MIMGDGSGEDLGRGTVNRKYNGPTTLGLRTGCGKRGTTVDVVVPSEMPPAATIPSPRNLDGQSQTLLQQSSAEDVEKYKDVRRRVRAEVICRDAMETSSFHGLTATV